MERSKEQENRESQPNMLDAMIAMCAEDLARNPQDIEARILLANGLGMTGRAREAAHEFGICLSQDPNNGKARLYFGTFLCVQGNLPRGIRELEQAVAYCSDPVDWVLANGCLGAAYHMSGNRSKAAAHWEVLSRIPLPPGFDFATHLSLAIVHLENGKIDRAIEEFKYAHSVRENDDTMPKRFSGVMMQMDRKRLSGWCRDSNAQDLLNLVIPLAWGICRPEDMF